MCASCLPQYSQDKNPFVALPATDDLGEEALSKSWHCLQEDFQMAFEPRDPLNEPQTGQLYKI